MFQYVFLSYPCFLLGLLLIWSQHHLRWAAGRSTISRRRQALWAEEETPLQIASGARRKLTPNQAWGSRSHFIHEPQKAHTIVRRSQGKAAKHFHKSGETETFHRFKCSLWRARNAVLPHKQWRHYSPESREDPIMEGSLQRGRSNPVRRGVRDRNWSLQQSR